MKNVRFFLSGMSFGTHYRDRRRYFRESSDGDCRHDSAGVRWCRGHLPGDQNGG